MTMEYFSGIKTAPLSYKTQALEDWFMFLLEVLTMNNLTDIRGQRQVYHNWLTTHPIWLENMVRRSTVKHKTFI